MLTLLRLNAEAGVTKLKFVSAFAAVLGGTFLMIKAVAILVTGNQPPLLFEVAPITFAVALQGLLAAVEPSGMRRVITQAVIVVIGLAAITGLVTGSLDSSQPESDDVISSLLAVIGGFGPIIALVILGRSVMVRRLWRGK